MTYFLDFDRTLFDTDAFVRYLNTRNDTKEILKQCIHEDIAKTITPFIKSGEVTFAPGELSEFMYSDVPEFLHTEGDKAVIVTYGDPILQKSKIENIIPETLHTSVIYTGNKYKGEAMLESMDQYNDKVVFVDDKVLELECMAKYCPKVQLFEIRRDGCTGDGRWQVINSLFDLPKV